MIKIYDCSRTPREEIFPRSLRDFPHVEKTVAEILAKVKTHGDDALREYSLKFDGVVPESLAVGPQEVERAYTRADRDFLETLERSAENIERFHRHQQRSDLLIQGPEGVLLGQKYTPIEKVGIYIPGGTASYPSSVLMNAIPAKVAGVKRLVLVTPPDHEGTVPEGVLAAAKVAGVDEIYKVGGAQAVAALAFGTPTVPRVDKIVGPGNIYVATAKRQVFGIVGIDIIAGPSEILIIADSTADPAHVAADMLSQAEHDEDATAVLVTPSPSLAQSVKKELLRQLPFLPRAKIAEEALTRRGRVVLTGNLAEAVEISNHVAPEHLEICTEDPLFLLPGIKNAGAIFLGKNSPEALGDYFAGPNHTLPTSGTARFSSPLSVEDFVKKSSFCYYSRGALRQAKEHIARFARHEGLQAHARSVEIRFENYEGEELIP